MAIDHGYVYTPDQYDAIIVSRVYPERVIREGIIISQFLAAHARDYDRLQFSVRIGTPPTMQDTAFVGGQRMAWYAYAKRIDILGWKGTQPDIIEVKERMIPGTLGQILLYRQLLLEELPGIPEPNLIAVGRWCDVDTRRALQGAGVTVYLYDAA